MAGESSIPDKITPINLRFIGISGCQVKFDYWRVNPRLSHDYPMVIPIKPYVKLYFKVIQRGFSKKILLIPRILPMILIVPWIIMTIPVQSGHFQRWAAWFSRRSWQRIWRRKRSAWKRRGWWSSSWERHLGFSQDFRRFFSPGKHLWYTKKV